jgi:hypothetical protein
MAGARKSDAVRDRAALLLAAGRSRKEIAETLKVCRKTLTNWQAEEAFQQRVTQFRDALVRRTIGRLAGGGLKAAKTLERLTNKATKDSDKIAAAHKLLRHLMKGADVIDLAERLDALERRLPKEKR